MGISVKKEVYIAVCLTFVLLARTGLTWGQISIFTEESFNGYALDQSLATQTGGKGWSGAWTTNIPGEYIVQSPMQYDAVKIGSGKLTVTASADQKIFRDLAIPVKDFEGTVWVRFFFKKQCGTGRAGLTLQEKETEKLFIGNAGGVKQSNDINKASVNIGDDQAHLIIIRIDFQKAKHTAYVFVDPGAASVPDPEGAYATIDGNFNFDRIAFLAAPGEKNLKTTVEFGPLCIANKFEDAVAVLASPVKNDQVRSGKDMKVISWKKEKNKLVITTSGGILQLTPFQNKILKVQFGAPAAIDSSKSFAVVSRPGPVSFTVKANDSCLELYTFDYKVRVIKETGRLQLFDSSGSLLIEESPAGARQPVMNGAVTITELFKLDPSDALFGLGQFRDGFVNLRGKRRELIQFNTQAAVPVVLSVKGWGLFWDNPSRTIFNDSGNGMSFSSDHGDEIKYYLFIGRRLDDLVAQYRNLTGEAPMLPRWALGYHQSRNRYASNEEVLAVADRMRKEDIPFSSLFIDYYYWGKYGTGSHQFDETAFPDMPVLADKIHKQYHGKLVVTVWPAFKIGTPNYRVMKDNGFLLDGVKALDGIIYDAFNPKASALYWELVKRSLLNKGIDGYFLDGPEPDNISTFLPSTTYYGSALKVRNIYPLMHSTTFYQGLLKYNPNKRPYILTRCAWASQQKNGTAIWSGDIPSTFDELKRQIPAGLNFVATGIPYWTTDIGGYSGGNPLDSAYQEVYTRWFQYGTFCPIFRSHGRRYPGDTKGSNELWAFGSKVQDICKGFDILRYRLMPYIYSLSGDITQKHYTAMRLLAFDFPTDVACFSISDQFMYGPAMLVCPVTDAGARQKKVYLPAGTNWINFWNGEVVTGGQSVITSAPIQQIPIFIKAGSIIPFGPAIQYTDELPADTVELRVYTGQDARFELYEDDGETFDYKKGHFQRTLFKWDESSATLRISALSGGDFNGRLKTRVFHIIWVTTKNGTGISAARPDVVVQYSGKPVEIKYLKAN